MPIVDEGSGHHLEITQLEVGELTRLLVSREFSVTEVAVAHLQLIASVNPAVNAQGPATLEAFLFDFSGDLYGRRLAIEFLKKLRDEAHFASLDELSAQIGRDCDEARRFFAGA